ncbi:helix-turn-helix domain-containing protein [Paraclostridium bifermentans]|uniref:helix-turn-helix domain-containing protein n=1 Tax=Paraclostridium bifermentans TaxID=1490 RepID=UPI0011DE0D3C|nr:helix-turn-helix transcriptional regulator [Paraclostridium bifermentans]
MFGRRLKELRLEKKINQAELGEIIGISPSTVGMYEREQRFPDKDTLSKIADYFEISVDYLLGRTDERNITKKKPKLDPNVKTIAAHRLGDIDDLDDDAIEKINEYIEFIRMQQNKNK